MRNRFCSRPKLKGDNIILTPDSRRKQIDTHFEVMKLIEDEEKQESKAEKAKHLKDFWMKKNCNNPTVRQIELLEQANEEEEHDNDVEIESFGDMFKIQYGEMSVLERLWRHREWSNSVWICIGTLVLIMLTNMVLTLHGNQGISVLRTGTKALICSVTNDTDMCNDLGTKVPKFIETLSLTEKGIKEELNSLFNDINKKIQELNYELNKTSASSNNTIKAGSINVT
ncbi:uncharacterized protein isoform X2 [Rhodnius prolixus]|uniref:uncharacterized protein isoform X2 n=1 Tax=Rhodnius prolixus TaxID=13249 RepID=UPI003D18C007